MAHYEELAGWTANESNTPFRPYGGHVMRNIDMRGRYPKFTPKPTHPNGTFNGVGGYDGWYGADGKVWTNVKSTSTQVLPWVVLGVSLGVGLWISGWGTEQVFKK